MIKPQPENENNGEWSSGHYLPHIDYNGFFGFEEAPFSIAPNPKYLFMSQQHQEAMAHLLYGVSASNGFVLLTGEVGTGKTTVIRALLQHLPEQARVAYIVHARLSARDLLETIMHEFGAPPNAIESTRALVQAIHERLLHYFAQGFRTYLLIDEAQNLSADVLEEIRLLTNLETDEGKLLHIILVGQPELRDLFQSYDLRQLNQRITARYHLNQLSGRDVSLYIQHRIAVARAVRNPFSAQALAMVARMSKGVPRLINIICDRALLAGYAQHTLHIDHKMVKAAAKEVIGPGVVRHDQRQDSSSMGFGTILFFCVILTAIVLLLLTPYWQGSDQAPAAINEVHLSPVDDLVVQSESIQEKSVPLLLTQPLPTPVLVTPKPMTFNEGLQFFSAKMPYAFSNAQQALFGEHGCGALNELICVAIDGELVDLLALDMPFLLELAPNVASDANQKEVPSGWFVAHRTVADQVGLNTVYQKMTVDLESIVPRFSGAGYFVMHSPVKEMTIGDYLGAEHGRWILQQTGFVDGSSLDPAFDVVVTDETLAKAVARFQREMGLKDDGLFGVRTLTALQMHLYPAWSQSFN